MNSPLGGESNSANGRVEELAVSQGTDAVAGSRQPEIAAQALVVDTEYARRDGLNASRYGTVGRIMKRVVARLIRFHTYRQDQVNRSQNDEIGRLRARLTVVEYTVQQRFLRIEADLLALRGDLDSAVTDFARIAERLGLFENTRRIVARLGPFRTEVRAQRRGLIELRQQLSSLSARLTLGQRELAPVHKELERFRSALETTAGEELPNRVASLEHAVEKVRAHASEAGDALNERLDATFASLRREQLTLNGALAGEASRVGAVLAELERITGVMDTSEARRLAETEAKFVQQDARVSTIAGELKGLASAIGRLQEDDASLHSAQLTLSGALAEQASRVGGVLAELEHITGTMDTSEALRLAETEAKFVQQDARVSTIAGELKGLVSAIGRLQEDDESLHAEQLTLGSALTEHASRVGANLAKLERITGAMETAETRRVVKTEAKLAQQATRVTAITDDLQGVAAAIEQLQQENALLRREQRTLTTAVGNQTSRVGGIQAELERIGGAMDTVETSRVAKTEAKLTQQDERVSAIAGNLEGILRTLERLQEDERVVRVELRMADIAGALNNIKDEFELQQQQFDRLVDVLRSDAMVEGEFDVAETAAGLQSAAQRRIGDVVARVELVAVELAHLQARLGATPYMSTPIEAWIPQRVSTPDDFDYVGFEDVFRGSEELVRERLRVYVPLLRSRAPVVELGCGRGEFLELMREAKVKATGVDINPEAVARCKRKRLKNVVTSDANAYLESLGDKTLGAVFSAQFAEHLEFTELLRFLTLARSRLVTGGLFIAETVNPNSIEGGKTFYVDLSHVKPLFPEVFGFLCRSVGFTSARVFYPSGGGFDEPHPTAHHEYAVVATA
jgi:SAM-dependent methyltransferase